jgi:hypothetical protein
MLARDEQPSCVGKFLGYFNLTHVIDKQLSLAGPLSLQTLSHPPSLSTVFSFHPFLSYLSEEATTTY